MTPSRILLYFCLSFIAGIFLSSIFTPFPFYIIGAGLILGILLISILWKYKKLVIVGLCLLFLILGVWRHQTTELKILNNELRKYNADFIEHPRQSRDDLDQKITLIGIVSDEPDIREKSIKLTLNIKQLTLNSEQLEINGKVLVTTYRYPEYRYGDKLEITGKLEAPSEDIDPKSPKATGSPATEGGIGEGFNYRNYLKKDGIYSIMGFPKIELLGTNFGNPIMKILFSFKNKFKETTRRFISPPQGGVLEALIFGDESNISKDWKAKLNLTGTRHITAVSGMNITILGFLILSFALSLGLWRQQALYLSIFLLLLYILMIGVPASAVRAGIMGFLLMMAQYFGRLNTATRAVIFAASFMLWFNPLLLRLDIGFQLSFLAILGLIYLQPFFFDWLKKIPNPKIFPVRTTLSATLAAQVFTLPILVYNFGYVPLLSPITNTLIVPFLAPITILIFIFGIAGIIFSLSGIILSWPTWFSLTYIVSIVNLASKLPFASLSIKDLHWIWLIISYLILGFLAFWLNQREKLKFLRY